MSQITTNTKTIRTDIVDALREYKTNFSVGNDQLGRLTGTNGTQISRALNGNFIGDATAFESRVEDFFKADTKRRAVNCDFFHNDFSSKMGKFFEDVRRTQQVGLAYSPAGKGKTYGIRIYFVANPTTIWLTLSKWNCGAGGLERQLFNAIETRSWKGNTNRGDFIVDRTAGSRRLIILDNAHRLTAGARQWLFDYQDATENPIALVGNPEILTEIRKNDQQFSRIGIKREIRSGNASADVTHMVALHWPEAAGKIDALANQVVREQGHLRSLKHQLLIAKEIASEFSSPAEAFRAAHTQLVRDYELQ